MLAVPDLVLRGYVPHRDIAWLYGPGSAWLPALAHRVFGTDLLTGRLVGLAYQATSVVAVFLIGLRWSRTTATTASLLAVLFLSTRGLTPLPWDAAQALALAALVCGARALLPDARRREAFACGALGGLTLVVRPDFALGVGAALLVLSLALPPPSRRLGLVGLAAGSAPWAVHLVIAGPSSIWRGLVVDPLELRASNRMPVPPDPHEVQGFIEKFINFREPPWPLPRLSPAAQLTVWFFVLALAVAFAVLTAALSLRRGRTPRAHLLAAAVALSVGLVPGVLQRADASHLSSLSPLILPTAVFALYELSLLRGQRLPHPADQPTSAAAHPSRFGALAGVGLLLLVATVAPTWSSAAYVDDTLTGLGMRDLSSESVRHNGRAFFVAPAQSAEVRAALTTVEALTDPGDRLFVGPLDLRRTPYNDSFFYYLLPQLEPATAFVYLNPAVALHQPDQLARDVASADVLILSDQWSAWNEPNDSREFGSSRANDVVQADFCTVRQREVVGDPEGSDTPLFTVFTRCGATSR